MSTTGFSFAAVLSADVIAKQEAASRNHSKEGTRKMRAIVNGIQKSGENNRKVLLKQLGFQQSGAIGKAPDSISMTFVDLADVPISEGDRINNLGIREYGVDVKGAPELTAWFARNADAYAAGPAGGLDPVTYAIMDRFFDPTNTTSTKDRPALLRKKIYSALPSDPSVFVCDVKLFKSNNSGGLTVQKIKAGDLVDVHNASFSIYVCAPKPPKSNKNNNKGSTPAPAAAAPSAVGGQEAAAVVTTQATDAAATVPVVVAAADKLDPPVILYNMNASHITMSERNFNGNLLSKLKAYFPPARQSLCAIPTDILANVHVVVNSGNFPADGVLLPGPAVYREEIIPTDEAVYLKPPAGFTAENTPVRELHGERAVREMFYQGTDPAAEIGARTTFPITLKLTWWREQCIETGITRLDDWIAIGARFPWRWTAVAKIDMPKTRSNDANKGDTKSLYMSLGTLETKLLSIEFDIIKSLEDNAVEVSREFVYANWPDAYSTGMKQGVPIVYLELKNEFHGDNPLHLDRNSPLILNLNEYTGNAGAFVSTARIFAVCNKQWTKDQMTTLKSLGSHVDREAVLRQTPEAIITLDAGEAPIKWLLYAVAPHACVAAAAAAAPRPVPRPISLVQ